MVSQVITQNIVASVMKCFVMRQEVDFKPSKSLVLGQVSSKSISVSRHEMVANYQLVGGRLGWYEPSFEIDSVQRWKKDILIFHSELVGSPQYGRSLRVENEANSSIHASLLFSSKIEFCHFN